MNSPLGSVSNEATLTSAQSLFGVDRQAEGGFTFGHALRALFKHKWTVLTCWVTVTAAVLYGLVTLPPTYTATAKVLVKIEEDVNPAFFTGIAASRENAANESANRRMETEMELAETWPVAADVVRKLGLTYDDVYQSPLTRLLRPASDLYDRFVQQVLGWPADPEKRGFGATTTLLLHSYLTASVSSKSSDTNSNLIAFTLYGTNPGRTRRSLEAVLQAYINAANEIRVDAARRAYGIVEQRVAEARAHVAAAQARLQSFLADNETAVAGDAAAPGPGLPDAPAGRTRVVTSPRDVTTLALLKSRLIDMQLQLVELRQSFRAPTERIVALEGTIRALRERIAREQQSAARNDAAMVEIDRELQLRQTELMAVERKLSQIRTFIDMDTHHVSSRVVVEPPLRPDSSDWKKRLVIAIAGTLGGLFLGLTLAGAREFFDRRLATEADVRTHLGLPMLAALPRLRRQRRRTLLDGRAIANRLGVSG